MTTNNTNNSENKLQFATYTSEKTGKTCPVVYGFSGKEDERLTYICNMEPTPKAKKGKKTEKKVHGYAYCVYSCLAIDGTNRVPCAIWGTDPRWHDVAKYAAEVINDLDTLTQEQYNKLGAMAAAVYNARKDESKAEKDAKKEEPKAEEPKATRVQPKGTGKKDEPKTKKDKKEEPKKEEPKATKDEPKKEELAPEVRLSGSKSAPKADTGKAEPTFTSAELSAVVTQSFDLLATAVKWTDAERSALKEFVDAVVVAAVRNKKTA